MWLLLRQSGSEFLLFERIIKDIINRTMQRRIRTVLSFVFLNNVIYYGQNSNERVNYSS